VASVFISNLLLLKLDKILLAINFTNKHIWWWWWWWTNNIGLALLRLSLCAIFYTFSL